MISRLSCGFVGRRSGRLLDRSAPVLAVADPCIWHGCGTTSADDSQAWELEYISHDQSSTSLCRATARIEESSEKATDETSPIFF